MWRPFTNSIEHWAPNCRIVYDKFHVLQHANKAIVHFHGLSRAEGPKGQTRSAC
jgi:transposase